VNLPVYQHKTQHKGIENVKSRLDNLNLPTVTKKNVYVVVISYTVVDLIVTKFNMTVAISAM